MLKVVFMGTPEFAVPTLKALAGNASFSVSLVVTQPDKPRGRGNKLSPTPVKVVAESAGIPVIQPARARNPECVERIADEAPDYLVVVAYGQILPISILNIPKIAPVNLHASILPRWRGAAPIHRAILAGDESTGVCAMLMEEGLDTGDTLLCRSTQIAQDDTVGALHDRLAVIGAKLMPEALEGFAENSITPVKQDDSLATYAHKLEKDEFIIDWGAPSQETGLKIRGLSPYPGAVTWHNGKMVKALFAKVLDLGMDGKPGEVLDVSREGMVVLCGQGAVLIPTLKPEGKSAMSAHSYSLGHGLKPGDFLGKS